MRHLFLINPASGKKGSTQKVEALIADFPLPHQVVYTTAPGDAKRLAREAALENTPLRIYVCGGDGTLNEVVNGVAGLPNVAITNVPKGTGNDFIKIFGVDSKADFLDLESLSQGQETAFDLMDCNGQLALDVVCIGIDARVGADVHRYKHLPLVRGMGAYALSLIVNVCKGINQPMRIEMGGKVYQGDTALLCICNGRYYGGGFLPVPEAMPDDGVLDVVLISDINLPILLRLVGKYAKGQYKSLAPYAKEFHGQSITLSSPQSLTVVADGEAMEGKDFTISLSPKKVNFFYPNHLSYQLIPSSSTKSKEKTAVTK